MPIVMHMRDMPHSYDIHDTCTHENMNEIMNENTNENKNENMNENMNEIMKGNMNELCDMTSLIHITYTTHAHMRI